MPNASSLLSDAEMQRVDEAVEKAQARTTVRLIPVISSTSGRYDRAEDMVGLWAAALGLALVWWILSMAPIGKEWALTGKVWRLGLLPVLAVIVAGFATGAFLATHIGWLRRLFISSRALDENVQTRAKQVYGNWRIRNRDESGGDVLVLYVSLYERRATVVANQRVQTHLPAMKIDALCKAALQSLHRAPGQGLCQAVEALADILAEPFPAETNVQAPHRQSVVTVMD